MLVASSIMASSATGGTATNAAGRRSPLYERHLALGAKTADFGGWDMPIEYAGSGVVAEHTAVRSDVGVFDVSHLGKVVVRGDGARAFLDRCLSNDLGRIGPGRAQYSLALADDGGVVDDLIVYLRADDDVLLVPNGANNAEVASLLRVTAPAGVDVVDAHEEFGILAVQGPRAPALVQTVGLPVVADYMAFVDVNWQGRPVAVLRSGYTGERGFELLVPWSATGEVWDAVVAAGALPCGLGARDTLRTEMGYPLHGQDLSRTITPGQARLGWAVGWEKPEFWGREAVLAERAAGPSRRAWGLRAEGRGIPRAHMAVLGAGGEQIGEVTSGTFSPTLKAGIALALLDPSVVEGDVVSVDLRGRATPFTVVKPPFVESHVR